MAPNDFQDLAKRLVVQKEFIESLRSDLARERQKLRLIEDYVRGKRTFVSGEHVLSIIGDEP